VMKLLPRAQGRTMRRTGEEDGKPRGFGAKRQTSLFDRRSNARLLALNE
jgi:hypothetical protein